MNLYPNDVLHVYWSFRNLCGFLVKLKLEGIPQCINQCDLDLKMHETNQWAGELCVCAQLPASKEPSVPNVEWMEGVVINFSPPPKHRVSRLGAQLSVLVTMHEASVNGSGPSVFCTDQSLFFPKLHLLFSRRSFICE